MGTSGSCTQRGLSVCQLSAALIGSRSFESYQQPRALPPIAPSRECLWPRAQVYHHTRAMDSADVARSIRKRAAEVRRMGIYIGFWEWTVWSFLKDVLVLMLFGTEVVDVRRVFGPPAAAPTRGTHRVAAVQCEGGSYKSAVMRGRGHGPVCNHFLVGAARPGGVDSGVADAPVPAQGRSAVRAAMRVGWVLRETTRAGDCGIDVMAYHSRLVRVPSSWKTIRNQLADFMLDVVDTPAWQDAFVACQDGAIMNATGKTVLVRGRNPVLRSPFPLHPLPSSPLPPHLFFSRILKASPNPAKPAAKFTL